MGFSAERPAPFELLFANKFANATLLRYKLTLIARPQRFLSCTRVCARKESLMDWFWMYVSFLVTAPSLTKDSNRKSNSLCKYWHNLSFFNSASIWLSGQLLYPAWMSDTAYTGPLVTRWGKQTNPHTPIYGDSPGGRWTSFRIFATARLCMDGLICTMPRPLEE